LNKGDITTFIGDAIVNAANERMLGGGGVDGAIHRAAGPELLEACKQMAPVPGRSTVRCPTGEARITPSFGRLQVRHVIHTVGPIYKKEATSSLLLASSYASSLALANAHGLKSIAFPAISCGVYGYPLRAAAKIALEACRARAGTVDHVHFFLFGEEELAVWKSEADSAFERDDEETF